MDSYIQWYISWMTISRLSGIAINLPCFARAAQRRSRQNQRGPGLLFAEGYESAEPDHAEAGSYSLIAAETRTGSQACA